MNDLASLIPNKWRRVGIQLGLTNNQLDAVAQNTLDPIDQFMKVLDWWQKLENTRRPCSWTTIVEVLRSNAVQEERMAEQLERKHCTIKMKLLK